MSRGRRCRSAFGRTTAIWHHDGVEPESVRPSTRPRPASIPDDDGPHPTRSPARVTSDVTGEHDSVAVKIKLKRLGKIREPHYRIVVADSRTKRDGRAIEEIGKYHPKEDPSLHRGRLRAGAVLARRRRAADRGRRRAPQDHRRLAEVQGPARRRGHPARRRAQGRQAGRLRGRRQGRRRRAAEAATTPKKAAAEAPQQGRCDTADEAAAAEDARPRRRDARPRPCDRGSGREATGSRAGPRAPTAPRPERARGGPRAPGPGHRRPPRRRAGRSRSTHGAAGATLEVRVHPDDLGKVIGRAAAPPRALRTVRDRARRPRHPGRLSSTGPLADVRARHAGVTRTPAA